MLASKLREKQLQQSTSNSPPTPTSTNRPSSQSHSNLYRQSSSSSTTSQSDINVTLSRVGSFNSQSFQRQLSGRCCSFLPFDQVTGGNDNIVTRSTTFNEQSLIKRIGDEHRLMESYMIQIKNKSLSPPDIINTKKLLMNLIHKHLSTCTILLQPAVKRHVVDSSRWVVHMCKEYETIDEKLAELRSNLDNKMLYKQVKQLIRQHIRDEESITLEWLSRRMSIEQFDQLSKQYTQMIQTHDTVHNGCKQQYTNDVQGTSPNERYANTPSTSYSNSTRSLHHIRNNSYAELFADFEQSCINSYTDNTNTNMLDRLHIDSTDTSNNNSPSSTVCSNRSNTFVRPPTVPSSPNHTPKMQHVQ